MRTKSFHTHTRTKEKDGDVDVVDNMIQNGKQKSGRQVHVRKIKGTCNYKEKSKAIFFTVGSLMTFYFIQRVHFFVMYHLLKHKSCFCSFFMFLSHIR